MNRFAAVLLGLYSCTVWAADNLCPINDAYATKIYGEQALAGDKNAQYDLAEYLISQGKYANHSQKITSGLCWVKKLAVSQEVSKPVIQAQSLLAHTLWTAKPDNLYAANPLPEALQWYESAASHGDYNSQFALYRIYWSGEKVPQDKQRAFNWLIQAAKQEKSHICQAKVALAKAYLSETVAEKNYQEARNYLHHCIDKQLYWEAARPLADLYAKGLGVKQNNSEAATYYFYAALNGDKEAQLKMSELYRHGVGVKKDGKQADAWLEIYHLPK